MIDYALIGSVLAALAVGGIAAWLAAKTYYGARASGRIAELTALLATKQAHAEDLERSQRAIQAEVSHLREELMTRSADLVG